jgi:PP-loop superfamily ATP-utilizing enzyme
MGILDNLEDYLESKYNIDPIESKDDKTLEKCHYCTNKAKYTDVAEIAKQGYQVVGVCQCHSYKGLSS